MNASWGTLVSWISQHWLLERLFLASLEFAILAVATAAGLWLVKPRTPRLVAFVWALVLAKPLVSLLIGSPIDLVRLSVPAALPAVARTPTGAAPSRARVSLNSDRAQSHAEQSGAARFAPNQEADSARNGSVWSNEAQSRVQVAAPMSAVSVQAASPGDVTSTRGWDWHLSVVVFWLGGATLMAIRALVVRRRIAQIVGRGRCPSDAVNGLYLATTAAMKCRRPPRLLVTDVMESPALVGLWRSTIVIPDWLVSAANHAALRWALRHELTHWKYGDLWLIRLREIARILFYFHPAAWWAGKQLEAALEIACDRAVITNETDAADYASRLYEILDAVRTRRPQPLAGGLFATRSQIARRLEMLVESPLRLRAGLTKASVLGVSLLTAVVLAVGSGLRHELIAQDDIVVDRVDRAVGTVVDEKSRPVADASIRFFTSATNPVTTTSDANGRFQFLAQQVKPGTLIGSDAAGKRVGYADWRPESDRSYVPQIVLKPVREVTVKVVDALGTPVAGATYASPGAQFDLDNLLFTGKTGEDGTARLRFSDDARLYQVFAFKSGVGMDYFVAPRRAKQESRERLPGEITLKLSGARTLTISAEDQKRQPVEGVRFSLDGFKKPEASDSVSLRRCDAVEITTHANGTAIFDWLPEKFADSLRFDCDSPEYTVREPRGSIDLLWLRHDDPAKEWTVPVLRRTAISGKVVDQNGKPLPGIIVKASGVGADRNNGQGEVITEAQGAYRMMVQSEQAYLVEVVDDRWAAPTRTGVVVHENQPVNGIDFKLDEGTILRGTVIDQAGHPLANRQVVLLLEGKQIPAEINLPSSQRFGATRLYHHRMSRSDERGQFQFRVARGTYKLAASEIGAISSLTSQADVTIDAQREVVQDLPVQVEKTVRLKGRVVDPDGKPVAEQRLFGSYLRDIRYDDGSFVPQTRPDGTFEVERKALPAVISVRIEDRKLGALARLDADQNEVAIQLSHLVEAHGRFVDDKGQGVAGRRVSSGIAFLTGKSGQQIVLLPSEALTDAQGRFTLRLLPGEEHTIRVREDKPRVPVVTLTKVAVKGAGPVNLGDMRIPPIPDQEAIALKGKVVGPDGKPVAGTEVRAIFLQSWTREKARTAQTKTSAEGAFEIKRPAVPAVISVRTADNKQGGLLRVDDQQTELTLRMIPLGRARGILTHPSGKVVPGAMITSSIIIRVSGGHTVGVLGVSGTTAADGSYTLEGLLPNETYAVRSMVTKNGKPVSRGAELATIKLEKAETVELGKTSLP